MESISRSGKRFTGKFAETATKIGLAKSTDEAPKKQAAKKAPKKQAKKK
jgi:hypothetical protein